MRIKLMLSGLISFFFFISCSEKNDNKIYSEKQIKQDTICFSYEKLNSNLNFISFEVPLEINKITDSLDIKNLKKILSDKEHFEVNKNLCFYNKEYSDFSKMTILNAGKINMKNHIYYYSFYVNFFYNCSECVNFVSLYEFDKIDNKLKRIPIGYQSSDTPSCFGDFNSDDKLDYLHWYYNDTVLVYSITKSNLKRDKDHFLTLNKVSFNKYTINMGNSKWW